MVSLRAVSEDDGGILHELLSDPEVAVWLHAAHEEGPFSGGERDEIIRQKVAHWTAHGFGMLLAFDRGRCIGRAIVQHNQVAGRSEVEIGWTVARASWGQGIETQPGTHALRAAGDVGLEGVVAFTRPENAASLRVMTKLGPRFGRDFEHAGFPHVHYSSTRPASPRIS